MISIRTLAAGRPGIGHLWEFGPGGGTRKAYGTRPKVGDGAITNFGICSIRLWGALNGPISIAFRKLAGGFEKHRTCSFYEYHNSTYYCRRCIHRVRVTGLVQTDA